MRASNINGEDDEVLVVTAGTTPVITSGLTDVATVGVPYTYTLTASGSPTPVLSFSMLPQGFQVTGPTISGTFTQASPVSIVLQATNVFGTVDQTLVVTVNPPTNAASITSALTAQSLVGASFSYTLTASGSPTPDLSFNNVPADLTQAGATISGTTNTPGVYPIQLTASNNLGSDNKTLVLTVGTAPAISSNTTDQSLVGATYSYTLAASGFPAPTLTFTSTDVPAGFTVNGAVLSGTFAAPGVFTIGIHAANTFATVDQTLTITAGSAPVITSPVTASAVINSSFSYTLTANGFPTPSYMFSNLPTGLNLDQTGTTISGTPTHAQMLTIPISATNIFGTDSKQLQITVGTVPVITSSLATITILAGTPFNYTLTATGSPTPDLSFPSLPSGLTPAGGTLSGMLNTPGQYTIGLQATNAIGSDNESLTVNVATLPVITSPTVVDAVVGTAFSYTLTATGSPTPDLSFTTALPDGFTANGSTLLGTFTTDGIVTIGLQASNIGGSVDNTLTITVRQIPTITSVLAEPAVEGADFTYTITAIGTAPITFGATNLPANLTLNGAVISGRIEGTGSSTVGKAIHLSATNAAGSDNEDLILTIMPNTLGIGGNWTGALKGKQFDQTGDTLPSLTDSKTLVVNFTQITKVGDSDLYADVSFAGGTPYLMKGRIGAGNFWLAGKDATGTNTVTLSGHVDSKFSSVKGEGLVFTTTDSEEFTLTLKRSK